MHLKYTLLTLCFLACTHLSALAQVDSLYVWPEAIPNALSNAKVTEIADRGKDGYLRIRHVIKPMIKVFLSPEEKANGTAVVICPGGGYGHLSIEKEGDNFARWFNEMGVAGIVLKYRLPDEKIMKDQSIGPWQDAQEAVRIVRRNADKWKINPEKIGIMGFSAGGHLASTVAARFSEGKDGDVSSRPDFALLIYPVITMKDEFTHEASRKNLLGNQPGKDLINRFSNELQISKKTPPSFLVHSTDDRVVPVENSIRFYLALKRKGVPAEMHLYERGGHGYGFGASGETVSAWPESCKTWMQSHGLLNDN